MCDGEDAEYEDCDDSGNKGRLVFVQLDVVLRGVARIHYKIEVEIKQQILAIV